MSDTYGAQPAADASDTLDHPFDAADQAAFDAMRAADGPGSELPGMPVTEGAGPAGDGAAGAGAGATEPPSGAGGAPPAAGAADGAPGAGAAPPAAGAAPGAGEDDDDDADVDGAAAPGADGQSRKPRRVSARKLQLALERAEAAEREREENRSQLLRSREDFARLSERLAILNEALTAPAAGPGGGQDQDPEPDPNEDIFAHNAWLKRQLVRTNEQIATLARRGEQAEGAQQLEGVYTADATAFARTPEGAQFPNAYRFMINSRWIELGASRFFKDLTTPEGVRSLTPQERAWIARQVQAEERQIVSNALQHGKSPAQTIMMLARGRGFAPQAAPAAGAAGGAAPGKPAAGAAPGAGARPGNGAAAPAAGAPSVTQEIERLRRGQDSSLSLSGGAAAPNQPMTVERLLSMSEADFAEYADMLGAEGIRQLHGLPSQ